MRIKHGDRIFEIESVLEISGAECLPLWRGGGVMAKMTFKLPEETIRKMEALGSHYDAVTSAVLEEGVKPLYDAAKQSLSSVIGQGTKEPWESTGDLLDSLSVTKPYQSADGNWNIKVGCIGYDRKEYPTH